MNSTLAKCESQQLAIDIYARLREKLSEGRRVLYLTDNCGGTYFDKMLILQLIPMELDVTVAVRGMAVINDATIEDAEY